MSWDNVSDIKNIKIWTDYSDSTQGHLFVNDKHQLKVNVGISFTLKSGTTEGPTEDEVYSALSLINNMDSGPLKYLAITTEGDYIQVYDPTHVQSTPTDNTEDPSDGIYDFIFTYWLYSPTNINAEAHTETVALKLAYSDSKGNSYVKETSRTGNYYTKTFITICCYYSILYGTKDQNRIPVDVTYLQVATSDYKNLNSGNFDHDGDTYRNYWLYIDSSYFKIFKLEGGQDPQNNVSVDNDLRPFSILVQSQNVMSDWVYDAYFPNVKCGEMQYDVSIKVMNGTDSAIYDVKVTVHQHENQITFITATTVGKHLRDNGYQKDPLNIRFYDQFGNSAAVAIDTYGNQILITSVS